jgi:hypothetical protein
MGASRTDSADVEVLTAAELAKPKPAAIRGVVVEGQYFRADLEGPTDNKGAEKGNSKTDEKGRFVFENLPPGKCTVGAAKPDGTREGEHAGRGQARRNGAGEGGVVFVGCKASGWRVTEAEK